MFDLFMIFYGWGGTFCLERLVFLSFFLFLHSSKHVKCRCIKGLVGYVCHMIVRYSVCDGQV